MVFQTWLDPFPLPPLSTCLCGSGVVSPVGLIPGHLLRNCTCLLSGSSGPSFAAYPPTHINLSTPLPLLPLQLPSDDCGVPLKAAEECRLRNSSFGCSHTWFESWFQIQVCLPARWCVFFSCEALDMFFASLRRVCLSVSHELGNYENYTVITLEVTGLVCGTPMIPHK